VDFFGIILFPLKWVVELILVAWHWLFTAIGLPAAGGITWMLSILGVVLVVRAALIPLFVRQIKSQRAMMELAPEIRKIQDRYRGKRDQLSREAMSRETMDLYKKHGSSPLSGCWPLLVQMPIFFSLYYTLSDVKLHAQAGTGGVGLLNAELTRQFNDAKLFELAPFHQTLGEAWDQGAVATIVILLVLVVLMIATQFITQLQIISKNLSPEAKTGQAYQMQKIMLWVIPLAMIFSGVFFPLGLVLYWFFSNLWTMGQQFVVIRELPTPGSEAAKAREERLARRGKALNSKGKVVSMAEYEEEQRRLLEEAEQRKAQQHKRQQPMGKQRAKKKQAPKPGGSSNPGDAASPEDPDEGAAGLPAKS
jgi:YidC/Oxa1 family membrane protein insertase